MGYRIQRRQGRGKQKRYVYTYPAKKALASIVDKVRALCQWPSCSPRSWPGKVPAPSLVRSLGGRSRSSFRPGLFHPEGLAGGNDDRGVMEEPVEEAHGCRVLGRKRPHSSKGQCEAMPRARRS